MCCAYITLATNQIPKHSLSFEKRKVTQIPAIQPKQIERVENWAAATMQQFFEEAPTV